MPENQNEVNEPENEQENNGGQEGALVFPVFPVQPNGPDAEQEAGDANPGLLSPNWEMWRTRGACRIWKAIMLTMGVKPTNEMRNRLMEEYPERYDEYVRRRRDVVAQYGLHPQLPNIEHEQAGEGAGNQYVRLVNLLSFAKEYQWKGLEGFEQGIALPQPKPKGENVTNLSIEVLPLGERNALVRTGALLKLIENLLCERSTLDKASLLRGGRLNISKISTEVEQIIKKTAEQESVDGFKDEANRRYFGHAQRALENYI